jgi:hypothetical protein
VLLYPFLLFHWIRTWIAPARSQKKENCSQEKGEFFEDDANLGMRLQEGMMTLICGHLEIGES